MTLTYEVQVEMGPVTGDPKFLRLDDVEINWIFPAGEFDRLHKQYKFYVLCQGSWGDVGWIQRPVFDYGHKYGHTRGSLGGGGSRRGSRPGLALQFCNAASLSRLGTQSRFRAFPEPSENWWTRSGSN